MSNRKRKKKKYIEISENDIPSKEKIWANLYRGRDFELSGFWQKSIFLFSLLTLCFTGYGALLLKIAEKNVDSNYIYEYMFAISIVGIILSYIWIAMSKGSKAWYEVYEKTIYQLETEIFSQENDTEKYIEGHYVQNFRDECDTELFGGFKGGPFSPSKINILIGDVMLMIWTACAIISFGNRFKIIIWHELSMLVLVILFLFSLFVFPTIMKKYVKSRILSNTIDDLSIDAQEIIKNKLNEMKNTKDITLKSADDISKDELNISAVKESYNKLLTKEIAKKIKKETNDFFEKEFSKELRKDLDDKSSEQIKQKILKFIEQITETNSK